MPSKKLNAQERYELRLFAVKHIALLMSDNCPDTAQRAIELVGNATSVYSAITYLNLAVQDLAKSPAHDSLYIEAVDLLDLYHELRTEELNNE